MKVRDIEALLRKHGWEEPKRKATSHRKWTKEGEAPIIIYGNATREADKGMQESVLKRLGLK